MEYLRKRWGLPLLAGPIVTFFLVVVGLARPFEPSWGINIIEGSNIRVLVTDPQGNRTGWDPVSKAEVKEIPESNYLDERNDPVDLPMFVVYLENSPKGLYQISAVGTGAGDFFIEIH